MEPTQKQLEAMIAAAGQSLPPEKVSELAANLLQAVKMPADTPDASAPAPGSAENSEQQ